MRATELTDVKHSVGTIARDFVRFVKHYLDLPSLPRIDLKNDSSLSDQHNTFGIFQHPADSITIQTQGRHLLDTLRTLAHELVHYQQKLAGRLSDGTASQDLEDHANALAGRILRDYYKIYPEYFKSTADQLTEQVGESAIPWDRIRAECEEILGWIAISGRFIYRGTRAHLEPWFQSQSRPARTPVDTDPRVQQFIDYMFGQAGLEALRSNSIYTTPRLETARAYGAAYMIFPRDGFHWTGSTKIQDLYANNPFSVSVPAQGGLKNHWDTSQLDDDMRQAYYASDENVPAPAHADLSQEWMRFKNNPEAMPRVSESTIIIAAIFAKYQNHSKFLSDLHKKYNWDNLISPEELVTRLGYNQVNLGRQLKFDNEILISGSYYAVHERYQEEAEIKLLTP
jgi:hypothetical protein